MSGKFSEGPWMFWKGETNGSDCCYSGGIWSKDREWVVADVCSDVPVEQAQANADLMAAAPEMYDALEALIAQGAFPTDAYNKALAALKKARGEQ